MKLIVITGGPCSGKTTLIAALAKRGYAICSESAAEVITEMRAEGLDPATAHVDRERRIFARQAAKELNAARKAGEICFLDRSVIDNRAYAQRHGTPPLPWAEHLSHVCYTCAFLLELLPWEEDGVRFEQSAAAAAAIQESLIKEYSRAGTPLVHVPVLSVEGRLAFILDNLHAYTPISFHKGL